MSTTLLSPLIRQRFFDATGLPLNGGKLQTYAAGTTTPQATYTDQSGNTPNANPVVLDSQGYCDLWLQALPYKMVLMDSNSNVLWTIDNVTANNIAALILVTIQTLMGGLYQRVVGSAAQVTAGFATDTTIASAIAAASAGGNPILILAGTYAENPTIAKQLSIFGTGVACIIQGSITFASGSNYSNLKGIYTTQNITLNSGTIGNLISEVFLAAGKTFIDSGTGNFVSGIQES
jgi:hypothetical protein